MSHHITFRQRSATGSELRLQVLEEPQVEIDLFVFRAVERADLRGSHAAPRRDLVGEDHGLGGLVLPAALFELRSEERRVGKEGRCCWALGATNETTSQTR